MMPKAFAYRRAGSVTQALEMLQEAGPGARLIAGGHSLLPLMKLRLSTPDTLVDIGRIAGLKGLRVEDGRLVVGALTTHHEVATSAEARELLPALVQAAAHIGDPQVRSIGTVGGNLAHADPASDLPAVALAYDAEIRFAAADRTSAIPAADFFLGPLMTALPEAAVLTAVAFTVPPSGSRATYLKVAHPASGYAVVGVAAVVAQGPSGVVQHVRIAVTGAGATPYRAQAAEERLLGAVPAAQSIRAAAAEAAADAGITGDIYASETYRRHLVSVTVMRALSAVLR